MVLTLVAVLGQAWAKSSNCRGRRIADAIRAFLDTDAPSWYPSRVNPFAGRLARILHQLAVDEHGDESPDRLDIEEMKRDAPDTLGERVQPLEDHANLKGSVDAFFGVTAER